VLPVQKILPTLPILDHAGRSRLVQGRRDPVKGVDGYPVSAAMLPPNNNHTLQQLAVLPHPQFLHSNIPGAFPDE
jgi:hypothetical protein